jgi:predicted nicotinamide N-methyase
MNSDETVQRLRRALLYRIHKRYETTTQRLRFGAADFDFTRIADPDRVLDQVAEEEDRREKQSGERHDGDQLHLPYWAELWDSATGIGQFLVKHYAKAPLNVLDLGCGMGLSGVVAASLGHSVLFADLEPPALLFAALNSLPWKKRVRTRQVNWQKDDLGERFDLILGADILYERAQWEHMIRFWRAHVARDGTIFLGEPGRQSGDLFITWITQQGWKLEQFEEPVPTRPRPVRIFRLSLLTSQP